MDKGRAISNIVVVILLVYFISGLAGILPSEYDIVKRSIGTGADSYVLTEYTPPEGMNAPYSITADSNNTMWFTAYDGVYKLTQSGTFTKCVDTEGSLAQGIVADEYDRIWFCEWTANKIGKYTQEGDYTEYDVTTDVSQPFNIDVDSHNNLWFTEYNGLFGGHIGKMSQSGVCTEYDVPIFVEEPPAQPDYVNPYDIVVDGDDNIWFNAIYVNGSDFLPRSVIFKMTETGDFTQYNISDTYPMPGSFGIAVDSSDNIWFGSHLATPMGYDSVGKLTQLGAVTLYEVPTHRGINDIAVDNNDTIWYTTEYGDSVASFTVSDGATEYDLGEDAVPYGICADNTDNIWFCEIVPDLIGKLSYVYETPDEDGEPHHNGHADVTITITRAGQWVSGSNESVTAYVNANITVDARIECSDGINTATIMYVGTDGSSGQASMALIYGTDKDGTWTGYIPAQTSTGRVTFNIVVVTDEDIEHTTSTTEINIISSSPPSLFTIDTRTFIYTGGIILLLGAIYIVNKPYYRWKR